MLAKPYYLLIKVMDDFGVPVDVGELCKDLYDTRAIHATVSRLRDGVGETIEGEVKAQCSTE